MRSRWWSSLAVAVVSLAVSLLVAEGLVRVLYPQKLYFNITQWDPDVGFIAIPNIESTVQHAEYTMHVRMNSHGLRDREFSLEKPPRTVRIGVFGDSFTFGEGVEVEETYPKLLEQLLNGDPQIRSTGWDVEVVNFGLGKTGTSHQLAWYFKEGEQYKLDIVLLGFLAGNDFSDNLAGVYVLRDGELIHNSEAYSSIRTIQKVLYAIPFYRWLAEHSHLVNLARVVATHVHDRGRLAGVAPAQVAAQNGNDQQVVELTLRLIEEFRSRVQAQGSEFLLVNLPARGQKPLAAYESAGEIRQPYIDQLEVLQHALEERNIEMLDLVPTFMRLPVEPYYYQLDGHMRPAGHEVVAATIHDQLLHTVRSTITGRSARAQRFDRVGEP